ncbi:hypothetical protein [Aquipuribacter sp. SD81]|uniref:hypothetical protein n=1 Tax=Aquipuribacter sp. SD81 TaxID=3127703 RepID=UPI00301660F6
MSTTLTTTTGSVAARARDDRPEAGGREARRARRREVMAARAAALPAVPTRTARLTGGLVAVGALSWATSFLLVGGHSETEVGQTVGDLMAVPFQAGLFALLALQLRTRAAGLGRGVVGFMYVEFFLLSLATAWSLIHGLAPSLRDEAWLAALDLSWPLSMLGMAVLGVKIAVAGRWRGPVRAWPAVAESWAPVCVPVFIVFGAGLHADVIGAVHLLLGYTTLGLLLLAKPHLTGARDA